MQINPQRILIHTQQNATIKKIDNTNIIKDAQLELADITAASVQWRNQVG